MERISTKETASKIGERVRVAGWVSVRRDHGRLIFIDLRDISGVLQLVFRPDDAELYAAAEKLRPEWVIAAEGLVRQRPKGMENPELETGRVELPVEQLEILSASKTPPFPLDTGGLDIDEEVRLKYRYLDLRRPRLKGNLILRDRVLSFIRQYLHARDFIEIETPILTKSTPEGARDYIVPSRLYPGKFFALPQSPQQYKQLLMVAGLERYFQIARCFRDEDTRGDRQPEFTQLDIEMSFAQEEDVLGLVENIFVNLIQELTPEKRIAAVPFPRLSYKEAIENYGTDKPDLRRDKSGSQELAFAFVVDFPMFEWKEDEKRWDAVHHPFTKAKRPEPKTESEEEFIRYIRENPKETLAHQYDLVLNGYEIGGGSIREHNPRILEAVLEIMGHTKEEVRRKFGHLLEAFEYGVPPHGGIAPGIDRLVMILAAEPNIREVIAFPKTGDARDLMMDAPSELEAKQLQELHLKVLREEK